MELIISFQDIHNASYFADQLLFHKETLVRIAKEFIPVWRNQILKETRFFLGNVVCFKSSIELKHQLLSRDTHLLT